MNDLNTYTLRLPGTLLTGIERTSSGRDLDEALDLWLAEDFLHEDYLHVHSWNDDEEIVR